MLFAFSMCLLLYEALHIQMAVQAYRPDGYIGCFKDWHRRVLNGKRRNSNTNSGDECKRYCMSDGYRYAGTESEDECYCGNSIRVKEQSSGCTHRCPGNPNEICGGHWRISMYDTRRCATTPCKNDATCVNIGIHSYNCICSEEWTGTNCDKKIETTTLETSSTSSSSSTTNTTVTSTTRTNETSNAHVQSTEAETQLSTRTKASTSFPNMKTTDDSSKAMVAMYVSLPVGVICVLIIIAVFLKWRQNHKKGPILDSISHGTGSVQNIYANLTSSQCYHVNNRNIANNLSGNTKTNIGKELDVFDKERNGTLKQEDEEYNIIALRPVNRTALDNTYNHVVKPTCSDDKSYSKLSAIQRKNNAHTFMTVDDTYSHIEKSSEQNHISSCATESDNTYNTFELRARTTADRTEGLTEEYSVYDHTNTGLSRRIEGEEDNYSRTVRAYQNDNSEKKNIGIENIYYNEDEYATVEKVPKK